MSAGFFSLSPELPGDPLRSLGFGAEPLVVDLLLRPVGAHGVDRRIEKVEELLVALLHGHAV
ncbi:MAG: hypothetical protein KHY61_08935, partial [Sutterella wadsworthensis]|nr:hypothetical protein [Sutterella wadsworthensis]